MAKTITTIPAAAELNIRPGFVLAERVSPVHLTAKKRAALGKAWVPLDASIKEWPLLVVRQVSKSDQAAPPVGALVVADLEYDRAPAVRFSVDRDGKRQGEFWLLPHATIAASAALDVSSWSTEQVPTALRVAGGGADGSGAALEGAASDGAASDAASPARRKRRTTKKAATKKKAAAADPDAAEREEAEARAAAARDAAAEREGS